VKIKDKNNMKNEKLLNFALESLRNGISVIPVKKDKIPFIPWREFQTRFATEEEVRSWFEKYEDPQIGFVTGKISNLTVVDVEKGGDPSFLPQETKIISTGGGGYHYYFKFAEGINNKARIKELVDIRGEGGYVVSPNSCSEKGIYELVQDASLLDFPKDLFPEKVDIFQYPEVQHFQSKTIKDYPGYGKGQRNDEMARYIGYVLTQMHPADWETEGLEIIKQANSKNTPPLSPYELMTTFNSIKNTERRKNPLGRVNLISQPEQTPEILDDADDEVKHIADVADAQKINSDEIYALEMPCFDKALGGGVNIGDVIVIAGQSGHGKTSLAQDWTMSLLRGKSNLKALWFSYEVLPVHLWKKFQAMGMTREDCAFIPAKHTTGNVTWVEKKIQEGKKKFGIKTVFIDHLGFLLPKTNGILGQSLSSNYASFLTQVMRDLKTIALKEEVIIFLPVHMKKIDARNRRSDIDDIKDTSGIAQESDLVFLIEREKEKDENAKSYFTDITKITLAKNRKTGVTVVGNFSMINGRFAYDDTEDQADSLFEEFSKPEKIRQYNDEVDEIVDESVEQEIKEDEF